MYYILYNKKSLKVEHIYNKPLTAKVCDNFYEINGIAEYHGINGLPKNDWLSVANIHEEVETWKEKQTVEKLDENGQPIINEQGEWLYEDKEVEKSKTHIVCDLVAHFYPKIELTEEQKLEREKQRLRQLRDKECFVYINRGELWYNRLTSEQKIELDMWYQEWLNVTETFIIPTKPLWLS
jgi:hypothetical protein